MRSKFYHAIIKKLAVGAMAAASVLAALPPSNLFATDCLTYHYDNTRDGANTNEVVLTPANVNTNTFSRLFTYTVDAEVYAQPLYMANVAITGQGTHNVLFIATENDTVYAFDADSNLGTNGGLLWKTNLGIAVTSVLFGTRYYHNVLNPLFGITGTPVIDPVAGTIYVDALTCSAPDTTNVFHHLHALNIANGTERPGSPVLVTGSVPGVGVDSVNGVVTFNATNNDSRPALTLAGGMVYVSFSSFGDTDPFHGWVIGFNTTNFQQVTNYTFVTTPNATIAAFGVNAGEASIWMGGDGLCVDSSNNLYFETGNGSFSANTNGGDYGDSFVKLSTTNQFRVADYFAPSNQLSMAVNDLDLGSGGPILLPDAVGSAAHPHLIIGAGKEGTFYLVDRDNMGHYSPTTNSIVQTAQTVIAGTWGTPAYFNYRVYNQSEGDTMKAFSISNGVLSSSPVSQSSISIGGTGYAPTISANGTSNAIAWVIDAGAYSQGANNNSSDTSSGPSILRAFNATNLSQQLYNSSIKASDNAPGAVKYPVPTVADGKVFVAGDYGVAVYGIGIILPVPVISPNGGVYTNSVTVTLTDSSNNVTFYYTLNGTTPTTNSTLYTGPFTLTNTVEVNAIAAQAGAFNSVPATASFINSSSIGTGTGLLGSYWSNTTSVAFTNVAFTNLPTLVRTDATVNFNFGGTGPAPGVGKTNYAVRWTGSVQPQFTEPYTFYTTADDGVLLYVNGQLLINDWVNQTATTESNTINLAAQQLYNIELEYYYSNDNGGQVTLAWSSPSIPQTVIPQTQLYAYNNPPPTVILSAPTNGSVYTATASVSVGAMADAPYNPVSQVAFYANGSLLGILNESPTAPLYSLTTTGFVPNPGGQTANSSQVSAAPSVPIKNLTTMAVEGASSDWTAPIWQTNGTGTLVSAVAGNTYACLANGTTYGNASTNTRLRNPAAAGVQTFAGNSLTFNLNCELRAKGGTAGQSNVTLNFPGVGGNPGLILNGGILNGGDDGTYLVTGNIQVASPSYICNGSGGGGGGIAANRAFNITGVLSGPGSMTILNSGTNVPQQVSGTSNTNFTGQWIVQCGWLVGGAANSLGTNSITVNPAYTGYLVSMPNVVSPAGPAIFQVNYPLTSSGALTLTNGGQMNLLQNCTFSAVNIEGTSLSPGTYSYATLRSSYPNNFLSGGSGSLTVVSPPGFTPGASSNTLTTTTVEASGTDWTAAIWQTNGTGTAVSPVAGNSYATAFNGTTIGNGLNNTRIRSPAVSGTATFAGDSLTLNANTELRAKGNLPTTLNFPGVNGNPGLILNGGMLNDGNDGVTTITGSIEVTSQSYNSAQGDNGGGGGLAPNPRNIVISGCLSGTGSMVIMNCSTNAPQVVSCPSNTFSGQWIVQCGWLQGTAANCLGTNSITVDPDYTGYLTVMPQASSPNGPAMFEVDYPLNSSGTLTLANGGMMNLLQNCTFAGVTIEGQPLATGTYSYAELASSFPANFLPGGSGSLTVTPPTAPGPVSPPAGLSAASGNASVSLSWNPSPGATNYILQRSTNSGGPYASIASLAGTTYLDTGLVNGTTYYYVVAAMSAPGYTLTAVATDGSGLSSISAPVQIIINPGSGLPYGMTTNATVPAFMNTMPTAMPATLPGSIPLLLSQTGVYGDTPNRIPASGLIPYVPNTPLWSDGAQKSRYMAVPNSGGLVTPASQIAFLPTNTWTFPSGTVFVKNFDLIVNTTNSNVPLQRLETRLLVRNINGGVYGVTYKWRPDNSDADLLVTSSNQTILVTNATGVTNQTWYYPSPVDCLTCHTAVANFVLGVNTRQLNGTMTYPATGNADNQLRTLNRLGLFYPAINEANISNYNQLAALTNLSAPLVQRARSYLDANCAQCHQPGGAGITFDARYDTPLAQQNITNYPAQLPLGIDHACIVKADDVWRSTLLVRMNIVSPSVQMPPLARNIIDTNAVQVITAWINSLPGTPALAPPTITPNGGTFLPSVTVTLQGPDTNAAVYYTLNGTLPTTNSLLYSAPFLLTNSAMLEANAFEINSNNSVAASALFTVLPGITFTSAGFAQNGEFQLGLSGVSGSNYVLQATTNLSNWISLSTNQASNNLFILFDPNATNFPYRFYRVLQP